MSTTSRGTDDSVSRRHHAIGKMKLGFSALLLAATFSIAVNAAQIAPASASTSGGMSALEPDDQGAPVIVWNRRVATLHTQLRGRTATERAQGASARIARSIGALRPGEIGAEWTQSGNDAGMVISAKTQVLFAILPGDVPSGDRAGAEQAGLRAAGLTRDALRDRAKSNRPMELFRAISFSVLATIALFLLCWLWIRGNRWLQKQLSRITEERVRLNIAGFDFRPMVWGLLRRLLELIKIFVMLFLAYLWLSTVLQLFPYSRPWGEQLGKYLVDLFERFASVLVAQIPNLITLAVILLITRGVVRLVKAWFQGLESGTVKVAWLEGPAAGVTRRLVSIAIWLFALIVAYPYIPGAGTDAFKGVSVFVGLMLSLGSAGVVNQAVSGLVVLYSGSIRTGDFVQIGDHQGVVREMGALSLKLLTRTREEVTVPNALLSSTSVRNLTRQSRQTGFLLTTSVTIGYDTPWRQVVALLLLAASRTRGLLSEPRPFVLQTSLSDFYIEYQLNVGLLNPPDYFGVLSELLGHIQDTFNEFGVQIMSPHFLDQPNEKVWVPKDHWYDPPSSQPERPSGDAPSDTHP